MPIQASAASDPLAMAPIGVHVLPALSKTADRLELADARYLVATTIASPDATEVEAVSFQAPATAAVALYVKIAFRLIGTIASVAAGAELVDAELRRDSTGHGQ